VRQTHTPTNPHRIEPAARGVLPVDDKTNPFAWDDELKFLIINKQLPEVLLVDDVRRQQDTKWELQFLEPS